MTLIQAFTLAKRRSIKTCFGGRNGPLLDLPSVALIIDLEQADFHSLFCGEAGKIEVTANFALEVVREDENVRFAGFGDIPCQFSLTSIVLGHHFVLARTLTWGRVPAERCRPIGIGIQVKLRLFAAR